MSQGLPDDAVRRKLYYIHGKDSGPDGFRAQFLKARYPWIRIPQLTNDIDERRRALDAAIEPPARLIGSSLGGLSALDYVQRRADRVSAMVLLAPAVGFFDPAYRTPEILEFVSRLTIPAGVPATVIAAINDDVIPLAAIEALVRRSPDPDRVRFVKLEDEHLLHREESLRAMTEAVDAMLAQIQP